MKLVWDQESQREYETGVSSCALYPIQAEKNSTGSLYTKAVAWNGITGITESPEGAEPTDLYADNVKYLTMRSAETLGGTIEAYMYPDEFGVCDGTADIAGGVKIGQQTRKAFGLAYKTQLGNDTEGNDHGYKLHLIYGCTASPSEKAYTTINDSPEANTFSWEFKSTPVDVTLDAKTVKTSIVTIDSTKVASKDNLDKLEAILFGSESKEGYLPLPDEVAAIIKDGSYTPGIAG